ncbi:hypothetical protein C8J56DRAFT_1087481 [Mycena floridula]|nr:hypothetical protein C8J56DRAFT_1087481 [Mycena floridula]
MSGDSPDEETQERDTEEMQNLVSGLYTSPVAPETIPKCDNPESIAECANCALLQAQLASLKRDHSLLAMHMSNDTTTMKNQRERIRYLNLRVQQLKIMHNLLTGTRRNLNEALALLHKACEDRDSLNALLCNHVNYTTREINRSIGDLAGKARKLFSDRHRIDDEPDTVDFDNLPHQQKLPNLIRPDRIYRALAACR